MLRELRSQTSLQAMHVSHLCSVCHIEQSVAAEKYLFVFEILRQAQDDNVLFLKRYFDSASLHSG